MKVVKKLRDQSNVSKKTKAKLFSKKDKKPSVVKTSSSLKSLIILIITAVTLVALVAVLILYANETLFGQVVSEGAPVIELTACGIPVGGWQSDTIYVLNNDVNTGSEDSSCFEFGEVTPLRLDCRGFSIKGTSASSRTGIILRNAQDITVENCRISGFATGIKLEAESLGNIINGNEIERHFTGILVENSHRNVFNGNAVNGLNNPNSYSLNLQGSNENFFGKSTFFGDATGIWLGASSNRNEFTGNIIAGHSSVGVLLSSLSDGNNFLQNNFADNGLAIKIDSGSGSLNTLNSNNFCSGNSVLFSCGAPIVDAGGNYLTYGALGEPNIPQCGNWQRFSTIGQSLMREGGNRVGYFGCPTQALDCGNNFKNTNEACDDGNTRGNDGCSADCSAVEKKYSCTSTDNNQAAGLPSPASSGFNSGVLGRTILQEPTGDVQNYDDLCVSSTELIEYYCLAAEIFASSLAEVKLVSLSKVVCASGEVCRNGACIIAPPVYALGDVNADEKIDVLDVQKLAEMVITASCTDVASGECYRANVDGDQKITVNDILRLVDYLADGRLLGP